MANDSYYHDELVEFIKDNCELEAWQIYQAWINIGRKCPIPDCVSDKIDIAITEFCIEQNISTDLVYSYEDAEDLFREIF